MHLIKNAKHDLIEDFTVKPSSKNHYIFGGVLRCRTKFVRKYARVRWINQFQLEISYCIHYIFYSHVSSTYLYFHQISTSGSLSVTEPNRTFESLIEFNAHRDNIVTWRFTSRSDHVSDMGWRGGSWTDLLHRSHPLDPTSFRRHVTMWSSQPRTVSRAQRTCDRGRNRNELQLGAVTERAATTSIHPSFLPSFHPSVRQSVSSVLLHSSLIMDCTVATSKTYLFFLSMVFWVSQEGVPVHLQGEIYLKLLQIIWSGLFLRGEKQTDNKRVFSFLNPACPRSKR